MSYESVDQLQKILTEGIFGYARSPKKAAGRALGTIVEIITFYLLKSWGLGNSISIEKRIPEFGNPGITHNVEYSLHPVLAEYVIELQNAGRSLTAHRLLEKLSEQGDFDGFEKWNNTLLSKHDILRNACVFARGNRSYLVASILERDVKHLIVSVAQQSVRPYAIVECKRVGVEEGMQKGPQTIEKAKQGAYVANVVSSLQKVRLENGDLYGILYKDGEVYFSVPYHKLRRQIIDSNDPHLLQNFILTVGVVSNHGNWFTADDHGKELKILAQSYDWLVFLTDAAITEFVEEVILNPSPEYVSIRDAFIASYAPNKKRNQFTKVKMNLQADAQLRAYFTANSNRVSKWVNIISPLDVDLEQLKKEISTLRDKKWSGLLR